MDLLAAPGRFYKGNIHNHSTASDAVRDLQTICAMHRDDGYDFLSLTDHFLPKFGFPITDTRPYRSNRLTPIPGAYVAIAHPAWYGLVVADAESITAAHAVKVYNHTSAVKVDRGDGAGLLDALMARGHRPLACATDDAHFQIQDWFGGCVMVRAEMVAPDGGTMPVRRLIRLHDLLTHTSGPTYGACAAHPAIRAAPSPPRRCCTSPARPGNTASPTTCSGWWWHGPQPGVCLLRWYARRDGLRQSQGCD